jgi:predicted permease
MLETLIADVRYALRWLARSPGFTLVAVASFAIGIGFNTALFTLVDALLFRPLPVSRADRLVDIYTSGGDGDRFATSSYPDYLDFKSQVPVLEDVLGYSPSIAAVNLEDRSRLAMGEVVTGNYFTLLGLQPALGRLLLPDDDRRDAARVVVLSHRLWSGGYASDPAVVGKTLRIHGQPYTIVGVAPREYTGMLPILSPELWTAVAHLDDVEPAGIQDSVPSPGSHRLERRGQRWLFLKGRLKPDATVAQAAAGVDAVMKRLAAEHAQSNKDRRVSVVATNDVHMHPEADRMLRPVAGGLMAVVGLVLLIACANVASMLLARASARRKEIGVRRAIGASRARLLRQLLTESLLVAGAGGAAGIALAWGLVQAALSATLPIPIPLSFGLRIDARVLAFTLLVTVAAAVVAGLAPALRATRVDLVSDLKGAVEAPAGRRRLTLRDGLVATQIAVTTLLLVTAGLLSRSLLAAQRIDVGFESGGLALVSTELGLIGYDAERARAFWEQATARVRALPGVTAVALTQRSPMALNFEWNQVFLPDRYRPGDAALVIQATRVSPGYFETLGVPLLEGRDVAQTDTPKAPGVVVVNEAMAQKYWPGKSALGQRLRTRTFDGPEFEVVGVVADYKLRSVGEAPTPGLHFAAPQRPSLGYEVVARTRADAAALVTQIRRELLALEPNLVFLQTHTMDAQVGATLLPARAGALLISAFGAVAMGLAAVGLYGAIAYQVARRTREIGIRMALGARPAAVLGLVMRQGLGVASAGLLFGGVLAIGAARALASALYGIGAGDPVAWLAAGGTVLAVSALANLVPARRAACVNPLTALRTD